MLKSGSAPKSGAYIFFSLYNLYKNSETLLLLSLFYNSTRSNVTVASC